MRNQRKNLDHGHHQNSFEHSSHLRLPREPDIGEQAVIEPSQRLALARTERRDTACAKARRQRRNTLSHETGVILGCG